MREIGVNGGKARTRKKLKAVNQNLALAMAARFPDSPKWNPDGMYDALLARRQGQSLDTYKRRRAAKRKVVAATATARSHNMISFLEPAQDRPVIAGMEHRKFCVITVHAPTDITSAGFGCRKVFSRWTLTPEQRQAVANGQTYFDNN
jgi:hypothetical protein